MIKKKQFKELGIDLKNKGRYFKTILTRYGYIRFKRTVLIPKDIENQTKLNNILKSKKTSIVPLDIKLGIENLPFKITCNMMLFIAKIAISQNSYEKTQQIIFETTGINVADDTIRNVVNYIGKGLYKNKLI